MSQQGPLLLVADSVRPALTSALKAAQLFPVIETRWGEAAQAIDRLRPVAVLAVITEAKASDIVSLAAHVAAVKPYLPLIAFDPAATLPDNAIPFAPQGENFDRLIARLRAMQRIRTLHATALRRLDEKKAGETSLPRTDPLDDATVLLLGRGASYPALSVALGERMAVVGALSIEAAAKHLSSRDIDGVVLGEGYSPRVVDAFLTVLSEDTRFRNLGVILTSNHGTPAPALANLEIVQGEPARIAAHALPLIRQHAFEARLNRSLHTIDANGLLDAQTGLLTKPAFAREGAAAGAGARARGGGGAGARGAGD